MSVVQEYWSGVLQRLQAEVDVFSRLVRHYAEQGRENEVALSRMLGALVPKRYGLGTGMIIDNQDNYSRQADIIVYDQADEPAMLAQTTQLLYPIESVVACIEVKTTLRKDSVADCIQKKASLQRLSAARNYPDNSTHPLFVVLAYESALMPEQVKEAFLRVDEECRPDLLCIVDPGILGGTGSSLHEAPHDFSVGLAIQLQADPNKPEWSFRRADPHSTEVVVTIDGRVYPVVVHDQVRYVGDPARALLLFVESLVRQVAARYARPDPVLTHYLNRPIRRLLWV